MQHASPQRGISAHTSPSFSPHSDRPCSPFSARPPMRTEWVLPRLLPANATEWNEVTTVSISLLASRPPHSWRRGDESA